MNTKDIVYVALFTAVMVALGIVPPITVPAINVPITAQSLGVMLAAGVLGARRGALVIVLFLLLVAIGLPVLAGGRGGFAVFLGPTAGFLLGWIVSAYIIGVLIEYNWNRLAFLRTLLILVFGSIFLLYAIGIPWIWVITSIPLEKAFLGSAAFIPGDIVKCVLATLVILAVKRFYPLIGYR